MATRQTVLDWIRDHKKELIICGVGIAAVVALYLLVRNWDKVLGLLKGFVGSEEVVAGGTTGVKKTVTAIPEPVSMTTECIGTAKHAPHEVSRHIRNLPNGRRPSATKVATALENGIILGPNQTWVDAYATGRLVA